MRSEYKIFFLNGKRKYKINKGEAQMPKVQGSFGVEVQEVTLSMG